MDFRDHRSFPIEGPRGSRPTSSRAESRSMPPVVTSDPELRKVSAQIMSDDEEMPYEQSTKILRLQKMRQMIIDSGVFSENDEVIKTINAQISLEKRV